MGFQIPKNRTAKLKFEEYPGMEVDAKIDVSVGDFMELQRLMNDEKPIELYPLFGDQILEGWNLEDNGESIPADGEGMMSLSPVFANVIIGAWAKAVAEVSAPLSGQSGDGKPLPEEWMSGEERSLNLGNFSKQS